MRGAKLLARDFAPGFKLDLHAKDLAIVLATARELGVALPGTAVVDQLFHAEQSSGHGEADNSTVVRALEALARHAIGTPPGRLSGARGCASFGHASSGSAPRAMFFANANNESSGVFLERSRFDRWRLSDQSN